MALSEPTARRHLHTRRIVCQGFARDDGLWDIEGRLTDTKTYDFHNRWRGEVAAGTPVHEMNVRLTLDDGFTVKAIEVAMPATPFTGCSAIEPDFQALVGERVGPGWNRRVSELVGGIKGCTHVTELLGRVAMAAYQTIPIELWRRAKKAAKSDPELADKLKRGPVTRPYFIDGCHSWRRDGEVVRQEFPQFFASPKEDSP